VALGLRGDLLGDGGRLEAGRSQIDHAGVAGGPPGGQTEQESNCSRYE
jgi:hypothetical protein